MMVSWGLWDVSLMGIVWITIMNLIYPIINEMDEYQWI